MLRDSLEGRRLVARCKNGENTYLHIVTRGAVLDKEYRVTDVIECALKPIQSPLLAHWLESISEIRSLVDEIAEAIPGLLYSTAAPMDGSLVKAQYVSRRAEEFVGHSAEDLMLEPGLLNQGIHPEDQAGFWDMALKTAHIGKPFQHEFRVIKKDGSVRWVQARSHATVMEDGWAGGWGVAIDITDRKNAEIALEEANKNLEIQVAERTRELTETVKELQEEIRQRERLEEDLRSLAGRLQESIEEERRQTAQTVHDEFGQINSLLKSGITSLAALWDRDPDQAREKLASLTDLCDLNEKTCRKLAESLRPALLDDCGLASAAEWLVREFTRQSEINADYFIDPDLDDLEIEASTCVFRILQECLSNILRHSKATEVLIRLERLEGSAALFVADNGVGIPAERKTKVGCFGLLGMRDRAIRSGGKLEIGPGVSGGTEVHFRIPVEGSVPMERR